MVRNKKEYMKEWRAKNREHIREYKKKYRRENPEKHIADNKRYREKNMDRARIWTKDYNKRNPEKRKARIMADNNIEIPKNQLCYLCKFNFATERHHPSYDKPLDVLFTCHGCHADIHRGGESKW